MKAKDAHAYLHTCAPDDEVFVLKGIDITSPVAIAEWIKQNVGSAPPEKLHEALDCAIRMRAIEGRKIAD